MEFVKGTVKKYSREYTRTLKDGKKKKYKTEQVQITVPKAENIFDDSEEVIILHQDDFNNIEDSDEIIAALELFNILLSEDNQLLESKLSKNEEIIEEFNKIKNSSTKEDLELLKSKLESNDVLINDLKEKINYFEEEVESKEKLISNLKEELSSLNNKLDNLPTEIELIDDYSKEDYITLQSEFIKLSKKFEILQDELFNAKINSLYHKNLANKCKRFILK